MAEENNIWSYLRQLSKNEVTKIEKIDPYAPLPNGIVTDGEGNLYEIPNKGKTPLVSLDDEDMKFSYNWENKEIEIYFKEDDKFILYDSYSLSPLSFLDNPEYWYKTIEVDYEDELASLRDEFSLTNNDDTEKVAEFLGIPEEKSKYVYEIEAETNFKVKKGDYENINVYEDDYKNKIENITKKFVLYGEYIKVTARFDDFNGAVYLIVDSSDMILIKEELMEIYDDYNKFFEVDTAKYSVKLEDITDIKEI